MSQQIEIVGFHSREGRNGPVDFVTFALPGNAKEATTVMKVSECAEKVPDYAQQIAAAHAAWRSPPPIAADTPVSAPPLDEQDDDLHGRLEADAAAETPTGDAA